MPAAYSSPLGVSGGRPASRSGRRSLAAIVLGVAVAVATPSASCSPQARPTEIDSQIDSEISRERAIEIAREEVRFDADSVEAVQVTIGGAARLAGDLERPAARPAARPLRNGHRRDRSAHWRDRQSFEDVTRQQRGASGTAGLASACHRTEQLPVVAGKDLVRRVQGEQCDEEAGFTSRCTLRVEKIGGAARI